MSARELPFNVEAEQAVLGGLMLAPQALAKISDWLPESDFYRADHRAIYRAICSLAPKGAVDAVTMSDWFEANGLGDVIGGPAYLIELANMTPSAANISAYGEIVSEKSRLRQAVSIGQQLAADAQAGGADARLVMATAAHALAQLQADKQRGGLEPVKGMLQDWFAGLRQRWENGGEASGLQTPFHDVNAELGGMEPGQLIILAARPSMGKTILALQVAIFQALRGIRTGYFSLEMTRMQLLNRAVACIGQVDYSWIKRPDPSTEEVWPRITNAMALLRDAPLLIDETPSLNIDQVIARAKRAHMQGEMGLIVVDHLHEMQIDGDNENFERARDARRLKALGKECGCPVLLLAQLNRKLEERADKRPMMSDLRGSGGLEEVADLICFLYRDDYYNTESHMRGLVEWIFGKNREGEKGKAVQLINRYGQMRAEDYDPMLHEPYVPANPKPQKSGWGRRRSNDD